MSNRIFSYQNLGLLSRTCILLTTAQGRRISKWIPAELSAMFPRDPKIRQVGDPVLREVAEQVDPLFIHSPDFKAMVERLVKVMRSHDGAGIAAPQIGVGLQVIAMEYTGKHIKKLKDNGFSDKDLRRMGIALVPLKIFINPKLKILDPKMVALRESCLSVEGHSALVPRSLSVEVSALNQEATPITWKASGWPSTDTSA